MNDYQRRRFVAELAEAGARAATALDCPRCGAAVLRGDDDDDVAYRATVDADPLDGPNAEWLAHLDGHRTFSLERQRGKTATVGALALWHRTDWHIEAGRQPREPYTLHRLHRCTPARKETPT